MTSTLLKTPPSSNSIPTLSRTVKSLAWVGSNLGGDVTRAVMDHDVSWLFEPIKKVAEYLVNEFRDSNKTVVVVNAAVFSDAKPRTLSMYNRNGVSSTLGTPSQFHKDCNQEVDWKLIGKQVVRCVRLDDYLPLRLSTLIVDTQGCDFEILRTVEPWLREGRIDFIRSECDGLQSMHDGLPDNSARSILDFMGNFDYTCRKILLRRQSSPDYEWRRNEA